MKTPRTEQELADAMQGPAGVRARKRGFKLSVRVNVGNRDEMIKCSTEQYVCITCCKRFEKSEFYTHSTGKLPALDKHSGHIMLMLDSESSVSVVEIG